MYMFNCKTRAKKPHSMPIKNMQISFSLNICTCESNLSPEQWAGLIKFYNYKSNIILMC